jgi:hypothetical protein
MNKYLALLVAALFGLALVALWLLRYAAFGVLMFVRPVFGLVFKVASGVCLFGLIAGFVIAPDRHPMLWGFFGVGVASTAILFCYEALVLSLAPGRFPMLLVR